MRKTFGIVGASGAAGQQVLSALQNLGVSDILLGGRNAFLLRALTQKSAGALEAKRIDIEESNSLDAFCSEVGTVVNCAGPTSAFGDLVAKAALRNQCNYVDAAGLSIVSEGLQTLKDEISNAGLSFVISAGWVPGISELLPAYAYDLAKEKFGSVDRVSVFFGDWGHWSENAIADFDWFTRSRKPQAPGTFQRGEWRMDRSAASRKENLGEPLVESHFASFYTPELETLGTAIIDAEFGAWANSSDGRGLPLTGLLPFKQGKGSTMVRKPSGSYNQSVGGFALAKAETEGGQCCTVLATFGKGRDYELLGAVLATAACLVGHRASLPGVHYFWEAFNRPNVVEWLKSAGVRIGESFN